MLRNHLLLLTAMGIAVLPAAGQTRRATITGGGGDSGKCTIEVRVDGAADVEISGDTGRIHTLQGQRASWTRFECSSPMPRNPVDFRFRGIDGRGNVQLVSDPRSRGVAVVRIEDNKGGSEGYTFDLEWRGGSGYGSNSGNYGGGYGNRNRDGYYGDNNRYPNNAPYYGNDGYNRNSSRNNNNVVSCSSDGNRRRYCSTDTSGGVRVVREYGNSACRLGSNWGFDRRGIWVERGCQADFQIGR